MNEPILRIGWELICKKCHACDVDMTATGEAGDARDRSFFFKFLLSFLSVIIICLICSDLSKYVSCMYLSVIRDV